MKILSLVAVLMFIHCCAAATNRSSVWLLGNTQIFTTNSQTSQNCFITGASTATATSSITLLTTSNLAITGTFIALGQGDADGGFVTSQSILYTVSIQFIYNSTYSLTLAIPAQGVSATPTPLTISTFLTPSATTYWTSTVSSTTTNAYPVVYGSNTILSPTGSTWLFFQNIPGIYKAAPSAGPVAATSGIIITDYVSSSTIAITMWNDNVTPGAIGIFNGFYQLGVRTKTSTISSSSSTLTNAASCTVSGRKRSVDHLINKRALSTCTSSSIDPSMSTSVLSAVCSSISTSYAATADGTHTQSDLADAFNKGITGMNALYETDYAVFGAGSSRYAIAANFGILIALSSIIFSFLN